MRITWWLEKRWGIRRGWRARFSLLRRSKGSLLYARISLIRSSRNRRCRRKREESRLFNKILQNSKRKWKGMGRKYHKRGSKSSKNSNNKCWLNILETNIKRISRMTHQKRRLRFLKRKKWMNFKRTRMKWKWGSVREINTPFYNPKCHLCKGETRSTTKTMPFLLTELKIEVWSMKPKWGEWRWCFRAIWGRKICWVDAMVSLIRQATRIICKWFQK